MKDVQCATNLITGEQVGTICTIIEHAIPIERLSNVDAHAIIKNRKAFAADIRRVFLKKYIPKYRAGSPSQRSTSVAAQNIPADNVEFELTLDADEIQPEDCCKGMTGWKYSGVTIIGKYTRRFKLVRIGRFGNIESVRRQLQSHGRIPHCQWLIAFMTKYRQHDNEGPIGICDSSWELDKRPDTYIPSYFNKIGNVHFSRADLAKDDTWRWLVEVIVRDSNEA